MMTAASITFRFFCRAGVKRKSRPPPTENRFANLTLFRFCWYFRLGANPREHIFAPTRSGALVHFQPERSSPAEWRILLRQHSQVALQMREPNFEIRRYPAHYYYALKPREGFSFATQKIDSDA